MNIVNRPAHDIVNLDRSYRIEVYAQRLHREYAMNSSYGWLDLTTAERDVWRENARKLLAESLVFISGESE